MHPRRSLALATLLACAAAASAVKIDLSRLREKDITLQVSKPSTWHEGLNNGVPIVDPPKRISGYFKLDGVTKSAQMFFFYFQARVNPTQAPVVLWMTGGPGCSSELAILYENGPYTFDKSGKDLVETQYGWDVTHNMIFVDQPIGTGFSYTDDDADTVYGEAGVAEDMLDFLHHFFAAHPELADAPFFVTGESYAGHYVPAVSHRVYLNNKNKEGPIINLQGLAVGNGLTEPSIQFDAYGDYAVAAGLIGSTTRAWMKFLYPLCRLANQWCESTNWGWVCSLGLTYCQITQFEPILDANPGVNVYDYSKKCDGNLCYDFTAADRFLNLPSTREALGVPASARWMSCNYDVYANFAGDWLHRFDTVLPDMLADGIKVMIYAGDLDIICNYLGNRRWVDALEWYGEEGWDDETDKEWLVSGSPAGKVKQWGPLSFVQVYKAGHMVPMDQPLNALAMITAWTRNHSVYQVMGGQHRDALRQQAHQASVLQVGAQQQVLADPGQEGLVGLFSRLLSKPDAEQVHQSVATGTGSQGVRAGVQLAQKGMVTFTGMHAARFVQSLRHAAMRVHQGVTQAARKMMVKVVAQR